MFSFTLSSITKSNADKWTVKSTTMTEKTPSVNYYTVSFICYVVETIVSSRKEKCINSLVG